MVDIDRAEMKKHTLHVEHPVWRMPMTFCKSWMPPQRR